MLQFDKSNPIKECLKCSSAMETDKIPIFDILLPDKEINSMEWNLLSRNMSPSARKNLEASRLTNSNFLNVLLWRIILAMNKMISFKFTISFKIKVLKYVLCLNAAATGGKWNEISD